MRKLMYFHETEKQDKEQAVANSTGFERAEVRDFHSVFTAHSSVENEISVNDVRRMLRHLVPVKDDCVLHHQLKQFVDEADQDRSGGLDFPEFLILLRRLQDVNFGSINDHSERVAASLRKKDEDQQTHNPDGKSESRLGKRLHAAARITKAISRHDLFSTVH